MKRKIICEIDIPEDFDACWNEPTGIQAFHDTIIVGILELGMDKIIQYTNYLKSGTDADKQFGEYLKTKHLTRNSLKIVGYVDDQNNIQAHPF